MKRAAWECEGVRGGRREIVEERVGKKSKGRVNIDETSKLHQIQQCSRRV